MKKLLSLGIVLVIIIASLLLCKTVNKQKEIITDEEAVHAYIVAFNGNDHDYKIKIGNNPTEGDDYIVYTVYKDGNFMTFGEIKRSYAIQFAE